MTLKTTFPVLFDQGASCNTQNISYCEV